MNYFVDKKDPVPGYVQLYRQLKGDIVSGVYAWGGRLPSKRTLAAESGVSVITTDRAYGLLCDEGYAVSREKSGYFAAYRAGAPFLAGSEGAPAPVGAAGRLRGPAGSFPFSVYSRTLRRVLAERGEAIFVKSPNEGVPELRRALSDYLLRSRGIRVQPGSIIIGSGAEYLYALCVQILGRNRIYGCENPGYEKIRRVYENEGVKYDLLAMGPEGITDGALAATGATVLHVTPFQSFPTGITAGASKRQTYLRWAAERGGTVIEDDYNSEFVLSHGGEETLFAMDGGSRVIYLNTFSRTVAPAVRMGYMILPEELLAVYRRRAGFLSCTVPTLEQYVLAALISGGDFERHIRRVRRQQAAGPGQ